MDFTFYVNGGCAGFGLFVLAGGVSMLRWPVRFFARWLARQVRRRGDTAGE